MTLTVNGADVEVGDRFGATGRRRRLTQATLDAQAEWWPVIMADVAEAVARQSAAVSQDVDDVILREVPQLRDDKPVLTLLAASVDSNVGTCLEIMRHQIDLAALRVLAVAAGIRAQAGAARHAADRVAARLPARAHPLLRPGAQGAGAADK